MKIPENDDPKKVLYCVIAEHYNGNRIIKTEQVYTHATDAVQARATFFSTAKLYKGCNRLAVIGIAPVVGYLADDDDGKNLSV